MPPDRSVDAAGVVHVRQQRQPDQVTDRKSQVTAYTYDPLNRQTQTTYHDSSTTANTYDAGDRLTQVVDSIAGTITRGYDLLDRLTSEVTPEGTVRYTYDAAARRATMTVAGQTQITYGYDNADRLTSITQGSSSVGFTYDSADRRTVLTLPNGVTAESAYNAASQVTGLTYKLGSNTLGDLTYSYDLAGNRTAVGGTWARTGLPTAVASATYNAANQIAAWGGTSFTYDLNGNLTNDGTTTYSWNARNQLTALTGSVSASFAYDGTGRRRAKTIGTTTTKYLYDGLNSVQELTSAGVPSANLLTGPSIDETFRRVDGTGTSVLLTDALGSTLELTDATGTLQTHYTYEPFGATTVSGITNANAAQFTGREYDAGGLYAFRARYYDSSRHRFVSEDPLASIAASIRVRFPSTRNAVITTQPSNAYSYTDNNPINFIDPLGLATGEECRERASRRFKQCLVVLLGTWGVVDFAVGAACGLAGPGAVPCIVATEVPQLIALGIHLGVGLPTCWAVYETEYRRCKGCK